MDFIPFKSKEAFQYKFYQIPQELFINPNYKNQTNSDAKILYGLLLSRLSLSIKNNWIDEDKNVYLIFTRKEAEEKLGLSDKTITKAFKKLKKCKLIEEKRQGANKPNLIYVGKIEHNEINLLNRKKYDSGVEDFTIQDTENLRGIYKDNKYKKEYKKKKSQANFQERNYPPGFLNSLYENGFLGGIEDEEE